MKQRVLTASLLIPPVLLAVFLSSAWPLFVLALAAFGFAYPELSRLAHVRRAWPALAGLVTALTLAVTPSASREPIMIGLAVAAGVGAVGVLAIAGGRRGSIVLELASLWIVAPLLSLVLLKRPFHEALPLFDFRTPVLLALVPLWIGDTLAIFVGRAIGRRPLAPTISPKKTVEGGIANLLGCVAGALGIAALIGQPLLVGFLCGLATGILGQSGDLLESAMKRSAGVKESGTLLPGHGGLLDRIDSILLSAPVVTLVVILMGRQ